MSSSITVPSFLIISTNPNPDATNQQGKLWTALGQHVLPLGVRTDVVGWHIGKQTHPDSRLSSELLFLALVAIWDYLLLLRYRSILFNYKDEVSWLWRSFD